VPRDTVFLSDLPGDRVWLVCDKCGRKGRYRIDGLIKKHGADARLIYLRHIISQCPKAPEAGRPFNIYDLCAARWVNETMDPQH
jgi:hypothetical protein